MQEYKNTPLWDNRLPIEERLDYLVGELTLEEKLQCLTTNCPDIERLGIKANYMGGEAAHGIEARHDQAFNAGKPEPTTCFPQPIGMSASFDRALIYECGRAVGEEARALYARNGGGGLCRWAPTIDMERDPRWGRTEEAYGEDPYLTGEMAGAYIRGMQGEDPFYLRCGATLKHFYANNKETDRVKISSSIDPRNKHEYYLKPFEKAITEAHAESIMTSYNEINGVPAIVNPEVKNVVKDTWRLRGHVVCDGGDFAQTVTEHKYFDTHAKTLAYGLKAGIDCFTDEKELICAAAKEALQKGLITEEDINNAIRNSFRTRIQLGFYDREEACPYRNLGEADINNREHQKLTLQMAKESVVLLKNEDQLLPLKKEDIQSVAVIGPLSDVWYKDWYSGIPPYTVTVKEGIEKILGKNKVKQESGRSEILFQIKNPSAKEKSYIGVDEKNQLVLTDREHAETFLVEDWGSGSFTFIAKSNEKYVTAEEETGILKAEKKEAFGWFVREVFHIEKLKDETYQLKTWDDKQVTVDNLGRFGSFVEKETVEFEIITQKDGLVAAEEVAKTAEYAIAVIGCNPVINSKEEIDRTTLELPPYQQELVRRIHKANSKTIVILLTNYPYTITEIDQNIPAILLSASGSQELGNGVAAVLFGKASPGARLNMTWYLSQGDLPDMDDYDIIKGKRTYRYFDREVLYPFGYGLSYTTFSYEAMQVRKEQDSLAVEVTVTNTGNHCGDEVVQLYARKEASRVKRPDRQLVGFERLRDMKPQESRRVSFKVPFHELEYYDVISKRMILEQGNYQFMAGASSKDIGQEQTIYLKGEQAGTRDPFKETEAEYYDDYHNMFLHRGRVGHTAVITGKPGDDPDEVPSIKIEGELEYRDFQFPEAPQKLILYLSLLEETEITVTGKQTVSVKADPDEMAEREWIEILLPEDFVALQVSQTIQLKFKGKCKIEKILFKKKQ